MPANNGLHLTVRGASLRSAPRPAGEAVAVRRKLRQVRFMSIPSYSQPIKNRVREKILEHAVRALTTERSRSSLVRLNEFDETLDHTLRFLSNHGFNGHLNAEARAHAREWGRFFETTVRSKAPEDLRVLYLCGPEPQNDLAVLTRLGVLPQHVWAIESADKLYKQAVEQLKAGESYIRVHHGGLENFLDMNNEVFDIIYIDACGPLPGGSPNTLRAPMLLFQRERLAPLGALITNFAEPGEGVEKYERIMSYYFAPRYEDVPRAVINDGAETGAIGLSPDELRRYISEHFQSSYSEFLTRFLVDLGREIIPYARIYGNSDVRKKYFANAETLKGVEMRATNAPPSPLDEESPHDYLARFYSDTGDVLLNSAGYPVLNFLLNLSADKALASLVDPLMLHQIGSAKLKDAFTRSTILAKIIEGHRAAASPEVMNALAHSWMDNDLGGAALFCDIPLPHLLINSLFGIYGHPYFSNPRAALRLSYVAKKTRMYTDVMLLDQCRYYFDYLPTIDLFPRRFQSLGYQLVLRTCLDRIGRHDFVSSSHPFRGAALIGFGDIANDGPYDFEPRVDENSQDDSSASEEPSSGEKIA